MQRKPLDLGICFLMAICSWQFIMAGPSHQNSNFSGFVPIQKKGRYEAESPKSYARKLVSLPTTEQYPLVQLVQQTRKNTVGRQLCGKRISYSPSSARAVADGNYRWLSQQLNCSSKLPPVNKVSLMTGGSMPDGLCCVFNGAWERNGGYLVRGEKFYASTGADGNSAKQGESQCRSKGGRWFIWNRDILTNTQKGDMFPYGRRIQTEAGDYIWEPVDYSGYNGAKWLNTSEPECPSRTISPLIVDFKNSGVPLSSPRDGVHFDLTARGKMDRISWPQDDQSMFLVLDKSDGKLNINGNSLFGNYTKGPDGQFADNGFLALAKYDSNKDGKIDMADSVFNKLQLWSDRNKNGISESGELITLKQRGVSSISLSYDHIDQSDEFGNSKMEVGSLNLANGQSRKVYDMWFAVGNDLANNNSDLPFVGTFWRIEEFLFSQLSDALEFAK